MRKSAVLMAAAGAAASLCFVTASSVADSAEASRPKAVVTFDANAPHDFPDRPIRDDYPVAKLVAETGATKFNIAQCGAFATWRIDQDRHVKPFTTANDLAWVASANLDDVARAKGYRVDHSPAVGALGVMDLGYNEASPTWGHSFYVARIYTDGSLLIEQYNWDNRGEYSTMRVPASWASAYIHFS